MRSDETETMKGKQVSHLISCVRANYFSTHVFYISHRWLAAAHRLPYRNNLSTFDIFYQIHFFPVQKLLIDLLLLSLSIALTAGG